MIRHEHRELVIVGGGAAGIAAAVKAYELGIKDILLLERDRELGGILEQCIHTGFGLHIFKEELSGPEYVEKWLEKLSKCNINIRIDASVLSMKALDNNDSDDILEKEIVVQSPEGMFNIVAKAIIFATGCMERPRGAISLPGPRVSGVMTAGSGQRFVNINGYTLGKKVIILGSGDIGLIMARRMTLEGSKVLGVYEIMPYSSGLHRNIIQCLEDFNIPLHLSKTVYKVHGETRLEGITIISVDEKLQPIKGTEEYIECDTLLLSVGLVPATNVLEEAGVKINPRSRGPIVNQMMETSVQGVFACGNVLHVHDLVDNVSIEGEKAALGAAAYLEGNISEAANEILIETGDFVTYTVPRTIRLDTDEMFYKLLFRVAKPTKGSITVSSGDDIIVKQKAKELSPGEMESVIIPKDKINKNCETIIVFINRDS